MPPPWPKTMSSGDGAADATILKFGVIVLMVASVVAVWTESSSQLPLMNQSVEVAPVQLGVPSATARVRMTSLEFSSAPR